MSDGDQGFGAGLQMELSLDELAVLYGLKGWVFCTDLGPIPPTAEVLEDLIQDMAALLRQREPAGVSFANICRLFVYSDPEMPDYYSIGLEIGLVPKETKEIHCDES